MLRENENRELFEHCKIEHRRWCYHMISRGWIYGDRDDDWHVHNCLLPFDRLLEDKEAKKTVMSDAMKLMHFVNEHECQSSSGSDLD